MQQMPWAMGFRKRAGVGPQNSRSRRPRLTRIDVDEHDVALPTALLEDRRQLAEVDEEVPPGFVDPGASADTAE